MKKRFLFACLFVLNAAVQLLCVFAGFEALRIATKVLLVPLAIVWYALSPAGVRRAAVCGAAFGWAGDVLLIPQGRGFFLAGLACFALGHVCYVAAFLRGVRVKRLLFAGSGAVCAGLVVAVFALAPFPPGLAAPAGVYAALLFTMAISALQLFCFHGTRAAFFVFLGGLCFVVSDALLGLFRFGGVEMRFSGVLVMGAYALAQALILWGLSKIGRVR
ncbi:MAG: lysoplasmalogenase [Spirochaetaceae bacterium]|nr:lysoplasmalogenase [Spirochaetaceae bacterium]